MCLGRPLGHGEFTKLGTFTALKYSLLKRTGPKAQHVHCALVSALYSGPIRKVLCSSSDVSENELVSPSRAQPMRHG